jgi:hypothetical protein
MQVYTLLIVYSGIFWSKHIAFVRFTEKTVGVVIVIDHLHTFGENSEDNLIAIRNFTSKLWTDYRIKIYVIFTEHCMKGM